MSKNQKTRKKYRLSTNNTTTSTTTTSSTTMLTTSDLSSSNRFSYVSSCSNSTISIKQARKQLIKAIIHEDIDLIVNIKF
jgi:hypothetical protein